MLCLLHNFPSLSFFPCSLSKLSLAFDKHYTSDGCLLTHGLSIFRILVDTSHSCHRPPLPEPGPTHHHNKPELLTSVYHTGYKRPATPRTEQVEIHARRRDVDAATTDERPLPETLRRSAAILSRELAPPALIMKEPEAEEKPGRGRMRRAGNRAALRRAADALPTRRRRCDRRRLSVADRHCPAAVPHRDLAASESCQVAAPWPWKPGCVVWRPGTCLLLSTDVYRELDAQCPPELFLMSVDVVSPMAG